MPVLMIALLALAAFGVIGGLLTAAWYSKPGRPTRTHPPQRVNTPFGSEVP